MNFRLTTIWRAATEPKFSLQEGLRVVLSVMLVPSLEEEQSEKQMLP